jgi:hypothetical protein
MNRSSHPPPGNIQNGAVWEKAMDTSMTNSAYAKNSGDGLLCSILCLHPVQIKAKILHFTLFELCRFIWTISLWLLECGAVKQWEMTSLLCAHCCLRIRPFRTRNRAGARVRSMAKFTRCPFAKATANCPNSFCHFHLISSVSRPQRPLIEIV